MPKPKPSKVPNPPQDQEVMDFCDMVPDVRMMIIENMSISDRCRFSRCSKVCNSDVKASKDYMDKLEIHFVSQNLIRIFCVYTPWISDQIPAKGFILEFDNRQKGKKYLEYRTLENQTIWKKSTKTSKSVVKMAYKHFETILKSLHNSMKILIIRGWLDGSKMDIKMDFDCFRNLRNLEINHQCDTRLILSKIWKPLTSLRVAGKENSQGLDGCEQIYQVQHILHSPYTGLNNQQFLELSASRISIHIGTLTPLDIHNFLNSWKHGKIFANLESCQWNLAGTLFSMRRFLELSGVTIKIDFQKRNCISILRVKHCKKAWKIGEMFFNLYHRKLTFVVTNIGRANRF